MTEFIKTAANVMVAVGAILTALPFVAIMALVAYIALRVVF